MQFFSCLFPNIKEFDVEVQKGNIFYRAMGFLLYAIFALPLKTQLKIVSLMIQKKKTKRNEITKLILLRLLSFASMRTQRILTFWFCLCVFYSLILFIDTFAFVWEIQKDEVENLFFHVKTKIHQKRSFFFWFFIPFTFTFRMRLCLSRKADIYFLILFWFVATNRKENRPKHHQKEIARP